MKTQGAFAIPRGLVGNHWACALTRWQVEASTIYHVQPAIRSTTSFSLKSVFIVYPHIFTTYKERTLALLLQCSIGLINSEVSLSPNLAVAWQIELWSGC